MRRLLLLLALALALTVAPFAAAKSAAPCRDRVYNDWYADGKIATTYSLPCYRSALAHLNDSADLTIYSSLGDDIRLALAAAVRRHHHELAPRVVGKGFTSPASATVQSTTPAATTTSPAVHPSKPTRTDPVTTADRTPADRTVTTSAAAASTESSGGTPVPLLVLGGLALALFAAGGVGAGVRRARRRRP